MPTPSVGRVVHYVSHGSPVRPDGTQQYTSKCRAATVTEVAADPETVGLSVQNPDGLFFHPLSKGGAHLDQGEQPTIVHFDQPVTDAQRAEFERLRTAAAPRRNAELCDGLHHDGGTWHWPARVG